MKIIKLGFWRWDATADLVSRKRGNWMAMMG
jgi:hypothetical protein